VLNNSAPYIISMLAQAFVSCALLTSVKFTIRASEELQILGTVAG
jgi:hypothetical protein